MTRFAGVAEPAQLVELAPMLRRAVELDNGTLARLRTDATRMTLLLRLPFGVLVSRTIARVEPAEAQDVTVVAADLLAWLDQAHAEPPQRCDERWRWPVPPATEWRRLDTVPSHVVRDLVRAGARTLDEAAQREGVPGARPRAEVAEALLDTVVLTVTADDGSAQAPVTLRILSALTRMGFLSSGSQVAVAVSGRWTRVAAEYGSAYAERPGASLRLL